MSQVDSDMNEEKSFDFPEFLTFIGREFNKKRIEFELNNNGLRDNLKKEFAKYGLGDRITHRNYSDMLQFVKIDLNSSEYNQLFERFPKSISFDEFLIFIANKRGWLDEFKEAFQFFDRNSDGYICRNDLKETMRFLGESFTVDEINDMLNEFSTTGSLNEDEFIKLFIPIPDDQDSFI